MYLQFYFLFSFLYFIGDLLVASNYKAVDVREYY